MEEQINAFLAYLTDYKQVSENTVDSYRSDLLKFAAFLEEQKLSLSRVTETNLNTFLLAQERKGLKPSSLSRLISTLHSFFLYLIKHGVLSKDPMERIRVPKPCDVIKEEVLSKEEVERLLSVPDVHTPKGLRDKAMLELLYATGIQVVELLSLTVNQVQLSYGLLLLQGKQGGRAVPFGEPAKRALEAYLNNARQTFYQGDGTDLLFVNRSGKEMTRQGFFKMLSNYGKAAGITKEVTPRRLRNSMIVHLLENGANPAGVQQLLGTNKPSAALRYYKNGQNIREVYKQTHPRA